MSSPDNPHFETPPPLVIVDPVAPLIQPDPLAASIPAPVPAIAPVVRDPIWSGWDVLLIALLTFVAMVVLQFAVAGVAQALLYSHSNLIEVGQKPGVLLLSQLLLYGVLAAGMILLVEGKYHVPFWQAIHWNWPRSRWPMLGLGGVVMIALGLLQNFLPVPKDTPFDHLFDRPRDAYILAIIAVTLAPLMEELFFHGFMYPALARRIGVTGGILVSAFFFGLIHLPQYGDAWAAGLIIFLVGVACGVVRATTRSVGAAVLVHAGYNGTQMLIAILLTHGFRHMEKAVVLR